MTLKKIKKSIFSFGFQHSAAHGVLTLVLELNSEIVNRVDPYIGLCYWVGEDKRVRLAWLVVFREF